MNYYCAVQMLADVSSMMRTSTPPAMVGWATFPAFGYNSGVVLLAPSRDMYEDAIEAARHIEPNKATRAATLFDLARKRRCGLSHNQHSFKVHFLRFSFDFAASVS
jgi:hypothetical protein